MTGALVRTEMRAWLEQQWDWLVTALFIAVVTSTVIGFKNGSKGGAILLANTSAAVMALVLYPFLAKYGYGLEFVGMLGLFCGACGTALFGVLIALSGAIDRRRTRIADSLIDRVSPESKDQ